MSQWYIYGLSAAGNQRVRYVGYTIDPKGRRLRHISNARVGKRKHPLYDWIRSLIKNGVDIEMQILEIGSGDGWQSAERKWISAFRPDGLFNVAEGGYAAVIPDESRKRAGEKLKTRIFTDVHRARISESKQGVARPDAVATAKAMSIANTGRKMNLSKAGRAARVANGKLVGTVNAKKMWGEMTDVERQRRSELASEQMRRVWAERKAAKNAA